MLVRAPSCGDDTPFAALQFTPDGGSLVYESGCPEPSADLWSVAADGTGLRPVTAIDRPVGLGAFGTDEAGTAKDVIDTLRPYRIVKITGGVLGGRTIDADAVQRLASLPPRETLRAQVAGAIAAPLATTAGLFDAPLRDIAGLVQALADTKGASAPAA